MLTGVNLAHSGALSLRLNFEDRPVMIIVQDESIFKAYDASKKIWKLVTGGGIRKKDEGTGVMVSAFLTEEMGVISFTGEEFYKFKEFRKNAGQTSELKYFSFHEGKYYSSIYLFQYGKDRGGYWNGDLMIEHTDEFVDALEFKFPGYFFVFLFDWSSGHAKYPKGAVS